MRPEGEQHPFFKRLPEGMESLVALQPEELASFILEYLNELADSPHSDHADGTVNVHNFVVAFHFGNKEREHERALFQAWAWLEREGLIVRRDGNWGFITKRGRQLKKAADIDAMRKADILPRGILHPKIAAEVWAPFLHGKYDTAVFAAFREVEIAVRDAGGYDPTDVGEKLMRKAFHKDTGKLTDQSLPDSEREALAHLFAGAMGYYRNPFGHRQVALTDPVEAVEMIMHASHLLKIVDRRLAAGI